MSKSALTAIGAAVVACMALGVSVFLDTQLSSANQQISSTDQHIGQLQQQIGSLRGSNSTLSGRLTKAEQELNAKSSTGDLITCADMKSMQNNISISLGGQDSAGDSISGNYAYITSTWLPNHCYKQ